jgi:putative glutamine amidotransferase
VTSTLAHGIRESSPDRTTKKTAHTVAVTATSDTRIGGVHRVRLNSAYVTALEMAGLVPIVIPPLANPDAARSIIESVDAVVLTGGEDVDPDLYGQQRNEHSGPPNRLRDQTEIALVLAAREARKPLLAICRGPQILNVALGGTLIQDIPSCVPNALPHNSDDERGARVHEVAIEPGSLIAAAVGGTRISVNSLHHQSILEPAPGLKVTARAPDGIIEGVESASADWWMLAVQWHPEEMTDSPEPWDRGIFRALAVRLDEG